MNTLATSQSMVNQREYYYFAFISYTSADENWATWLQKSLEHYSIPIGILKKNSNLPNKIRPVFWYKSDLSGTMLHPSLHKELEESQYLLVICSPYSAKSSYVNEEVQYFIDLGRINNIIPIIVNGEPHAINSALECFPSAILKLPREKELRGINMQEYGRKKGLVNTIATLLGIRFDILWNRHKRRYRYRISCLLVIIVIAMMAIYLFVIPMHMTINLIDEKTTLPTSKDAKLRVDESYFLISQLDTTICLKIKGIDKSRKIRIVFSGHYYEQIDTNTSFGIWYNRDINLYLRRDHTFSKFKGIVIDMHGNPVQGALVEVDNFTCTTDTAGSYNIDIPVERQSVEKKLLVYKEGYDSITKQEIPSDNATHILIK